jgi:hypothetical protein
MNSNSIFFVSSFYNSMMSPVLLCLLLSGLCVATAAEDPVCSRLESADLLEAILVSLAKAEQPDFSLKKGND